MKYGLMELFQMHHSDTRYGVPASDRIELFGKAKAMGFAGIEFGLGLDYAEDPLWAGKGSLRRAIGEASAETGVAARSICLHLFNYREYSPASEEAAHRAQGREILEGALAACREIGASVILVPFFGTAALETRERIEHLVAEMRSCAPLAESLGVCLGLETTLEASALCAVVDRIDSEAVQVYFDTGNTAGLGYDVTREIEQLGSRIAQLHIKDHPSVPVLGEGEVDFGCAIRALHTVGFDDYLVLELPTLDDGAMQSSLAYLRGIVEDAA
jgi:sugar phosphate isomerase/epimerase